MVGSNFTSANNNFKDWNIVLFKIPQFDVLCFGTLVWSLIVILILLYMYSILNIIPFFVEIKKLRLKKSNEDNLIKQIIIINKYLKYNLKLKKFTG
nr:ATPase subunit 8 [Paralia sulcata]